MKVKLCICSDCFHVKKFGEFVSITVLDEQELARRIGDWDIRWTICPSCKKSGD